MTRGSRPLGTDCTHTIYVHKTDVKGCLQFAPWDASWRGRWHLGIRYIRPGDDRTQTGDDLENLPRPGHLTSDRDRPRDRVDHLYRDAGDLVLARPLSDDPRDLGPEPPTGVDRQHDCPIAKIAPGDDV